MHLGPKEGFPFFQKLDKFRVLSPFLGCLEFLLVCVVSGRGGCALLGEVVPWPAPDNPSPYGAVNHWTLGAVPTQPLID